MAEYAEHYGGPPRPDDKWPMFLGLIQRTSRFEARAQLRELDAVTAAIATAFGGESTARAALVRLAYPTAEPIWAPNLHAEPEAAGG